MVADVQPGKHRITWDQLAEFAKAVDREITHVFRVFKGERESPPLAEEFQRYFGFAIIDAELAGRRRARSSAA